MRMVVPGTSKRVTAVLTSKMLEQDLESDYAAHRLTECADNDRAVEFETGPIARLLTG